MAELNLKSGTKSPGKKLKMVKMTHDVSFFGLHGSQISEGQSGVHIAWTGDHVVVTSDSHPGERWILPGGISHLSWEDA